MADGLCVEGTATNNNGTSVNETIDLLGIPRTDSLNTKGLKTMKPAFYINGASGELCSNFRVNGVVTLGVHASRDMLCSANTDDVDFTSLCPDSVDNCRKKRCADRYDSSESSDSGVATLSCTDCSASSSSATSDITEPGSPFSTASCHSSQSDGGVEGGSGGGGAAEQSWPPGSPSAAADPSAAPAPSPAVPHAAAGAPAATVVVLQPYFMAPNVPSDQRDDSLHCWAWAGVGVGGGDGKDGGGVDLELDRGPPPPPPPLQQPPSPPSFAPLSPVTANNVLASINSKALKRQTAIVSHKTASVTPSPGNKRLKLDHSPSSKPGLANNNNNNNNASGKNGTSLCAALRHQPQRCCAAVLHPKTTVGVKGVKADAKARAVGPALAPGDVAAAHGKLQQQGKITEYFKTQMKPMNGLKKDLTAKAAAVVGATGLPGNRKSAADVKTDKNSVGGLEKYFNVNSGTQSSTVPLLKVPEVKDLIGANLPASAPVQSLSWNSKCNTMCSNRSSKSAQKANEKKSVVALSSPVAKEMTSPATSVKIPEVKKNGFVSLSLPSQKLDVLLLPPPSTQKDSSPPSTYSPNLPESTSCVMDVTQKASDVVYDVPKLKSASDDQLPANEVMVTSTPVGKITPVSEDSAMSTSGDQTESIASVSSDSGLSISVSSSSPVPSSLPSPILSVPRTIRFPAVNCNRPSTSKGTTGDSSEATCRWTECNAHFDSSTSLLEHLQVKHVNTQGMCETFVCLWVGCKVYSRTSCSRSWLERHVLSHGGNKPFPCIVDGCGQRFSSQTTLERHVNSHFNQSEAGSSGSGARRSVDSSSNKLFRRNGKRLRLRRQPWSARMFDYFDTGIMEGLQHRLMSMTEKRTLGDVAAAPGNTITLHSKVMGRRVEPSGQTKVLLKWYPEDILDDEWVLESNIRRSQNVPISQLPSSSVDPLYTTLFSNASSSGSKICASTSTVDDGSPGSSINSVASTSTSRRKPRKQGKPIS